MTITALPTPPSRDDPANFSARADAFLGALPTFATEANALATQVNGYASDAAASAAAAAAAAGAAKWVSGTTYAEGNLVWSPTTYFIYRRKSAGAGTTDPSSDTTNWALVAGTGNVTETGTQTLTNKTLGATSFTGANTFYNDSGQVFGRTDSTKDGINIGGANNGSSSRRLNFAPAALSGTRAVTFPDPGADYTVGYLNMPQNSQSAAYTFVLTDAGKHILHPSADTTARTFTIPANSSVAFPIGTAITIINQNGAGTLTIAITTDTMRLAGLGTTGSRTLTANGIATAVKVTSTEWIISGTNLT
jgi:hypothetical protein